MNIDVAKTIQDQLDRIHRVTRSAVDAAVITLETSVLGGILLRPSLLAQLDLKHTHFLDLRSQYTYRAMVDLAAINVPIDVVSVESELTRRGVIDAVGGAAFLGECAMRVPTPDNVKDYALQIKSSAIARHVYITLGDLIEVGREHLMSGEELLNVAMQRLGAIEIDKPDAARPIGDLVRERFVQMEEMATRIANGEEVTSGAPTGVAEVDARTGGYPYGVLSIVCGRPAMGKSSFLLAGAQANAVIGNGVHIFSMEDTSMAYAARTLSQRSKVPLSSIVRATVDRDACSALVDSVGYYRRQEHWLVDERPGLTGDEVVRSVRRHMFTNKTRVAMIDYATLLKGVPNERKQQTLEKAALAFQIASKDDGMAYVLGCQLNRKIEDRIDRRPTMADLREAGELEEYCKFMIGLYRGFAYNSPGMPQRNIDYECDVCDQSQQNCLHLPSMEEWSRQILLLILKHSNGATGIVTGRWDGPTVSIW